MPYRTKSPLLTRPTKFYSKNLELTENKFIMYLKKNIHLSEKSFSVFNGPPPNTIEHTKTYFGQMFHYFLYQCM